MVLISLAWCSPNDISQATKFYEKRKNKYLLRGDDLDRSRIKWKIVQFITDGDWDKSVAPLQHNGIAPGREIISNLIKLGVK